KKLPGTLFLRTLARRARLLPGRQGVGRMRRFLVSVSCPWVFRSPAAHARQLRSLARTEQGSYLSLQWAAQRCSSVERQALFLRHAADEARHAQIFWSRAAELEAPIGPLVADAEDLFEALGEV